MMKRIEQKVIKFIDENDLLQNEDNVLVSLSGGPDSVFLLYFLVKFRKRFKISIGAFHLNHKIRGKDADKDEKFCKKLCEKLDINFYSSCVEIKKIASAEKISVEEAGRNIRYVELKKISENNGYNKIATAHNLDDNAETVLLNLVKGTGLRGMAGIPVRRGNIVRPVLILTKKEILEYLKRNNLTFRKDKTNLLNDYERNFIRNKIIPLIKKRLNPSFETAILNSSKIFRRHVDLLERKIEEELENYFEETEGSVEIDIKKILTKGEPERSEIIKAIVDRNFYVQSTFNDLSKVLSLITKQTGTKVSLTGGLTAAKEREAILIYKKTANVSFSPVKIIAGEKIKLNGSTLSIIPNAFYPAKFSYNRLTEYISADNLKDFFVVRRWENGDRFYPLGLKGSKKVSDFLNEQKILSGGKKNQLVLTNDGKIVWIIGLRIDDRFKITHSTKKVYQLCLM